MNKRCIVNVATGEFYCKMQERLLDSFEEAVDIIDIIDKSGVSTRILHRNLDIDYPERHRFIDMIVWEDCLPKGSRSHEESPYGFKVHAIKAAYEKGYTSILWLDSPAYAVKEDISPIFDKIEKEGYYAMSHIDPLENYVGDFSLNHFGVNRRSLEGHNLPSGSCYGFDMKGRGLPIMVELAESERKGLFRSEVSGSFVHRHDEAILSLILLKEGFPIFTFDPLFQSDSPECVIKSGGLW